jgi:hypothetical protein
MLQVQTKQFGQGEWEVYYEGRILPKYVKADVARIRRERDYYSDVRVLRTGDAGWITPAQAAERNAARWARLDRLHGGGLDALRAEALAKALAGQA